MLYKKPILSVKKNPCLVNMDLGSAHYSLVNKAAIAQKYLRLWFQG